MESSGPLKTASPSKLAHVVLRTNNLTAMRHYYLSFLGATIAFEVPDVLAFLRHDEEHHRLGLIAFPKNEDKVKMSNGIEHFAFTFSTLDALLTSYQQRRALGMEPFWCINHGPTTSMYYKDPDGNIIETEYNTLSTEEADDVVASEAYRVNPIGVDFDPEELIKRMEAGEPLGDLVKRPDIEGC